MYRNCLFVLVFAIGGSTLASAQPESPKSLRVFFDCQWCDKAYLNDQLPIVDFVNERKEADVHVLLAFQQTAGGGWRYTMTLLGQRDYASMGDTLNFVQLGDVTQDEERRGIIHHLTVGLARYLARAGLSDKLTIGAIKPTATEEAVSSIETDPWNYWAFTVGGNMSLNGQASSRFLFKRANFSANRTTEALKVRLWGNLNDTRREFDAGDETIKSGTHNESVNGLIVRSIGSQWAIGARARASASSFQNTKLQVEAGPAIEYDFFPYSQSTRKLLTVQYSATLTQRQYDHLTIFALEEETILRHSLEATLSLTQKWGSISLSSDLNHNLTNFDRSLTDTYNLGFYVYGSVRLFRGLSIQGNLSYNRVRDQIDLPATAATKEEILLSTIRLPTGYQYYAYASLTYRFGSIYNNVVNPRMN